MKKFLLVTLALIASAVFASAVEDSVPSKNVVGYVNIEVPATGGFNLVCLNFRAVGGGDLLMSEVFGTDSLVQGNFPAQATRIYFFDAVAQAYQTFFQKTDDLFYDAAAPFGASADPAMPAGTVFWLQSPVAQTEASTITLLGEAVGSATVDQVLAGDAAGAYNFFNNAFAADMTVSDVDWSSATAGQFPAQADRLYIWNGTGYDAHFLSSTTGNWKDASAPFGPDTDPNIGVGIGAFYQAKVGFTVSVERPYTYPID
jgi:hypothetical protein